MRSLYLTVLVLLMGFVAVLSGLALFQGQWFKSVVYVGIALLLYWKLEQELHIG